MKDMLNITIILILAYAFSNLLSVLQTAAFLSQHIQIIPSTFMLCVASITATIIACSTGTSSGTIAVLVPILVPIIFPLGIDAAFVLVAIVSGAVFGNQNSPISDSVILTSSLTEVDIMEHIKT